MFGKRGEEFSLQYALSLIVTLLIIITFAGCGYKLLKPNYSKDAKEVYDSFLGFYEKCTNSNENDCSCGVFDYSKMIVKHDIKLESLENNKVKASFLYNDKSVALGPASKVYDVKLCAISGLNLNKKEEIDKIFNKDDKMLFSEIILSKSLKSDKEILGHNELYFKSIDNKIGLIRYDGDVCLIDFDYWAKNCADVYLRNLLTKKQCFGNVLGPVPAFEYCEGIPTTYSTGGGN